MQHRLPSRRSTILILSLLAATGCSGSPGRIRPPDVDAESAAAAALEQLDKDGNGQISSNEVKAAPGLEVAMPRYDQDQDGNLASEEIAAGIRRWSEGEVGVAAVPVVVELDGRGLPDAEVVAIPEPFLGDAMKEARSERGYLTLPREDRPKNAPNVPVMQPGLYRIQITDPRVSIPPKYNAETTLGLEVSRDTLSGQAVQFQLTTKEK